ncbi:3-oxoacyl-[acyl-carrier-protein] synthase [Quercus suber]|uniref:beta-ketoacyl-[acyl-carrier-protein] synthase I n=1 Tax=Quercus suber TaxID=58331 RepID=A0AAW0J9C9_QUESU
MHLLAKDFEGDNMSEYILSAAEVRITSGWIEDGSSIDKKRDLVDILHDFTFSCQEHRSIARFIGYALCAADEAIKDAKWVPSEQEQKERTGVSIGGGIGSITDILDAAQMICEKPGTILIAP